MENVKRLSEIIPSPIPRAKTGFEELDYIYGYSRFRFPDQVIWGMPEGMISLWTGTSGIGKSRMSIEVAKSLCKYSTLTKVLYFQTESSLSDFASWAKNTTGYDNFYCSGESSLEKMIAIMYNVAPHFIFIDSVNEIEEFENGNKKETRRLIKGIMDEDGNTIKPGLKKVCQDLNCHIIVLAQLNQDGKTIKGGSSLPHMVDIALNLRPFDPTCKSTFNISVGVKHRCGRRGPYGTWQHEEEEVKCRSDNRLYDKIWCETHGLPLRNREQEIKELVAPTTKNIEDKEKWIIPFLWRRK